MKTCKYCLLGGLVLFLLFSCRTDDEIDQPDVKQSGAYLLKPEQIPDIIDHLGEALRFEPDVIYSSNNNSTHSLIGKISMEEIVQILDETGNANYTFGVDDGDGNPYTILNLVLRESVNGHLNEPYLMYYELDPEFISEFEASGRSFENFSGKITKKYISGLSGGSREGYGAALTESYNVSLAPTDPCDYEDYYDDGITTGGSGTGGGTNDGSTDNGGPGNRDGFTVTIRTCEVVEKTFDVCITGFDDFWGGCPEQYTRTVTSLVLECTNTVISNGANDGSGCFDDGGVGVVIPTIILDTSLSPYRCVADIISEMMKDGDLARPIAVLEGADDPLKAEKVGHIGQELLDFFDQQLNYSVTFLAGEAGQKNGRNRNAKTSRGSSSNSMVVTLDDDLLEHGTDLAVARTIVHETFHAYIGIALYNHNEDPDLAAAIRKIWQEDYNGVRSARDLSEHDFMYQFIDAMAYSISVWHKHKLDFSYYQKLAWGGLTDTDAFYNLKWSERSQIEKVQLDENNEKRSGSKGVSCN